MQTGSLVICVDDTNWRSDSLEKFNRLPVKGQVYQVRAMIKSTWGPGKPDGVFLVGFKGKWVEYTNWDGKTRHCECHFRQSRFAEFMSPMIESELEEEQSLLELTI